MKPHIDHLLYSSTGEIAMTCYFLKGTYHRRGGPAVMNFRTNYVSWYVKDVEYYNTIDYCKACRYNRQIQSIWVLRYGETLPRNLKDL